MEGPPLLGGRQKVKGIVTAKKPQNALLATVRLSFRFTHQDAFVNWLERRSFSIAKFRLFPRCFGSGREHSANGRNLLKVQESHLQTRTSWFAISTNSFAILSTSVPVPPQVKCPHRPDQV